jgi:hypothetical protein
MGRGRLPGKRIVACSASKVTSCSSIPIMPSCCQ